MAAAVYDLLEELAHRNVDGVADKVGIQGFQQGFARQDLRSHSGGMRHAGAADRFHERLLHDALLDVERQLAGALLGSTPADAVR